jgi:hypothetical protein
MSATSSSLVTLADISRAPLTRELKSGIATGEKIRVGRAAALCQNLSGTGTGPDEMIWTWISGARPAIMCLMVMKSEIPWPFGT